MSLKNQLKLLLMRATHRDGQAEMELFERFKPRVFQIAFHMLRSKEDAMDCTQECMIRFFQNIKKMDVEKGIEAWLKKVIVRLCLDRNRKEVSRLELPLDGIPLPAADMSPQFLNIGKLLDKLSVRERAAFLLVYYWGMSSHEAGNIMGISSGSVKTLCFRSRSKLREQLRGPK